VRVPESLPISPSVRDALTVIYHEALELIIRGASLDAVLEAFLRTTRDGAYSRANRSATNLNNTSGLFVPHSN
jgi:hypothetical protein